MRYTRLGSTSIEVSVIAFGAWAIGGTFWGETDEKAAERAIKISIDAGINFIDTAPGYGLGLSEEILGRAIKGKRDSVVISTKCGIIWDRAEGEYYFKLPLPDKSEGIDMYRNLRKESIKKELQSSLSRLNTDYIDLYFTHWPDPQTPAEETMNTLIELKEKGYIRAIGVSNVSIDLIKEFAKYGKIDADQEQYSLIDRNVEAELLPWCRENGASMLAYSPLSKGLLTGKLNPDRKFSSDDIRVFFDDRRFHSKNIEKTNKLLKKHVGPIAEKHNASIGNIAVAYLISNSSVIALCGARNEIQAAENSKAGDIILDNEDKKAVELFISNYKEDCF
jgi:aryl-alcohol dehydrogenase-like predicted oxidoreductase